MTCGNWKISESPPTQRRPVAVYATDQAVSTGIDSQKLASARPAAFTAAKEIDHLFDLGMRLRQF